MHTLQSKVQILLGVLIFLAVATLGIASVVPLTPDAAQLPTSILHEDIPLPNLQQQLEQTNTANEIFVSNEKIQSGDTLSSLLKRLSVDDSEAMQFIRTHPLAKTLLELKAGRQLEAKTNTTGQLMSLRFSNPVKEDGSVLNTIIERANDKTLRTYQAPAVLEKRIDMRMAKIDSSLFAATDNAQIPDPIAMQLIDLFATNIDFRTDLRRGDYFKIVYETFWQGDEYVRSGRILSAEFVNQDKRYSAFWFDGKSKTSGAYYTYDGQSLKKAFLRSPIAFTRISSGFSMRIHPISGQWKQHKGVDFAAATGTPIHAAGDGTIDFVGTQRGYGNVVMIKHWSGYSTVYGHLNGFKTGLRKGQKVNQGDLIGYVGATGWATGPHLHYEFRVNNEPRDPLSIEVPNVQHLAGQELKQFQQAAQPLIYRLSLLDPALPKPSAQIAQR